MSHLQLLRLLISDRLTAAANEIFGAVERAIAEYEEELSRYKLENNHQHRPPEVVLKHEVRLQCADPPQLSVCEEELPLETQHCEQDWSSESYYNNLGVCQEEPPPPQVKQPPPPQVKQPQPPQVKQEPCSSQEEEQTQRPEEADTTNFPFTPTCVSSCIYQEDLTQLQTQDVGNEDGGDPMPSTSAEQMKAYSDGEDYGKSDPSSECQPLSPVACPVACPVAQSHTGPRSGLKKPRELRMSKGHKLRRRTPTGNNVYTKGRDLELHHRPQPERQRREKAYCCGVCGKEFTHSAHLITHTRIHTGERLYSCKVCGKEFRHGHSVLVHMRIHREEKPYCCQLCGKQFRQVGNLNVHMRVHTGERPYGCKVCGKKFSRNNLMTNHMAMHKGDSLYVKNGRKESVGMHA